MRRGLAAATGSDDFDGRRVGVVGLGKVGSALAAKLAEAGAQVIGCDLDAERAHERWPTSTASRSRHRRRRSSPTELDVLAPCAAGGLIDEALARSIDCRVVAGAANNPLTDRAVARTLMQRDIVYVPDFLANCGGLIHVSLEWYGRRRGHGDARRAR